MKKLLLILFFIVTFVAITDSVSAFDPIPSQLQGSCQIVMGTLAVPVGSYCVYPGYPSNIQNRIVCQTTGPSRDLGTFSSICCDTQTQCTQLAPTPASYITPKPGNYPSYNVCNTNPDCMKCMFPAPPDQGGVWTAIGCIPTEPSSFVAKLLTFGIGIAGGIAFLLILLGGFQMMTSAGNPEQLNAGKELVSSAITGLILIIFSVFLLRIIGVNILGVFVSKL